MTTYYHVTPVSNTPSILAHGLLPSRGARSGLMEERRGVYLFVDFQSVEDAMANWLGELFDDVEEDLAVLKVTLPPSFELEEEVGWERISRITIPAECIEATGLAY